MVSPNLSAPGQSRIQLTCKNPGKPTPSKDVLLGIKTLSPSLPSSPLPPLSPRMKWPLASTAEHMRAASSLLLPVLLAEVCLGTSLNLSSQLPEAQAELESQDPQNQTWVPSNEEEEEYWLRTSQQQLSNETSNFGFSLLRKISMRHDGNVIFSPFGLSVAMVNLMLGAKGETKVQVENGLHLQALSQAEPLILPSLFKRLRETLSNNQELNLTQGSFAFIHKDFDIKETYFNLSKKYFDTECVPTNFQNSSQAKGLMNYYINKETRGKIPKLFNEINPETKLILVDYILFKGILLVFSLSLSFLWSVLKDALQAWILLYRSSIH